MRGIPWQLIIAEAPRLITMANELLVKSRRHATEVDSTKSSAELRDRVAQLVKDQEAAAGLMKQLADQVSAITQVAHANATRARQGILLGAISLAVGVLACVLALVR